MGRLAIGVVLPLGQYGPQLTTARWSEIRDIAIRCEEIGFDPVSGPPEAIADRLRSFRDVGFTRVECMVGPGTMEAFEALAPVLELLDAD